MFKCPKCERENLLPAEMSFRSYDRTPICKECNNARAREWRAKNKDKARSIYLKYQYGISLEEYETLMKLQGGKCAICGNEDRQNLSVDHNHETGKVRGLLCQKCNAFIGMINEDVDMLEKIRNYLIKYTEIVS